MQLNDGISFVVQPGEIAVVLGENGAGKTTLVRVVSGILDADHGEGRSPTVRGRRGRRG